MHLATWNVQGLNFKLKDTFSESYKMKISNCVLTETKNGKGNEELNNYFHFYSGVSEAEEQREELK